MEDAILCNARINTIEASDMYLFIDKAFQEKEKHKFIIITALLIALCIVCILLFILSVQLKNKKVKWNKLMRVCRIIFTKYNK